MANQAQQLLDYIENHLTEAEALAGYRLLDADKGQIDSFLSGLGIGRFLSNEIVSALYTPFRQVLINDFGDGRHDFANVALSPDDKGDTLTASGSAPGNTLIIGGLGSDTITDNTTGSHQNLIVDRGDNDTIIGGTPASLHDNLLFGGETIGGSLMLNASGAATDDFGRSYQYDQANGTIAITDLSGENVTIKQFQNGDFGLDLSQSAQHLLTFSEFAIGTTITNQYENQGILFSGSGSGPFITTDDANPTSPVLSGSPLFSGSITGDFVTPSGATATVSAFSLDAGYFDDFNSTQLSWYDVSGHLLGSEKNQQYGIEHFSISSATPIASFSIGTVGYEAAGFAIDNVAFNTPVKPSLSVEHHHIG